MYSSPVESRHADRFDFICPSFGVVENNAALTLYNRRVVVFLVFFFFFQVLCQRTEIIINTD